MELLFSLDAQLIYDAILLAIAILVMFTFLSYLLFNPARDFLKKRQERVKQDIDQAAADKEEARKLREDYESRIQNIQAEADEILSAARKKRWKMKPESWMKPKKRQPGFSPEPETRQSLKRKQLQRI